MSYLLVMRPNKWSLYGTNCVEKIGANWNLPDRTTKYRPRCYDAVWIDQCYMCTNLVNFVLRTLFLCLFICLFFCLSVSLAQFVILTAGFKMRVL